MFDPRLNISSKLLSLVVKAELDFFYVKSVTVPDEWILKIKSESLVKRIVYGLKLEGIDVASDVVAKVVLDDPGRDEKLDDIAMRTGLIIKENELQAIINMINALKLVSQIGFIASKFAGEKITSNDLVKINKIIGERLVTSSSLGFYRSNNLYDNPIKHPYFNEIDYQLDDFMNWFLSQDNKDLNPILVFAILFKELIRIWPFEAFNFLSIVLFVTCYLNFRGYVGLDYSSIEEEIWRKKQSLFDMLSKYQDKSVGEEEVLEFVVGIIVAVASRSKTRVSEVESHTFKIVTNQGRAVPLSERQIVILEEVNAKGQLTIKDIREVLSGLSDDTILREIKDLLNKKMIKRRGKTKGAIYLPLKVK